MFDQFLDGSFMPHGYCLQWRGDLLFMTLVGDGLTVLAYGLIPLALIQLVRTRNDLRFNHIFILFAAFIAFCGLTHAINILNVWNGYYYIAGVAKLLTGLISITTAYVLWKLMPVIVSIPSVAQLREQNQKLLEAQEELRQSNLNLEEKVRLRTEDLQKIANTDQLTQVKNRGAILEALEAELKRTERYDHDLSLLMLDLDFFKEINDKHGHLEGDDVLSRVATTIRETCRQTDSVGRYGGEEFLVILPETSLQQASDLAGRIRLAVSECKTHNGDSVTCSIGVSHYSRGDTMVEMIKVADNRVYRAKDLGRNTVVSED